MGAVIRRVHQVEPEGAAFPTLFSGRLNAVPRPALPLRAAVVLDRPASRVAHALRRLDLYERTAHVFGFEVAVAPPGGPFPVADSTIRLRRGPKAIQARVSTVPADWDLPTFTVVGAGFLPSQLTGGQLRFHVAETAAGTVLTAEFLLPRRSSLFVALYRGRVLRILRHLLGIATLILREDVVVVAAAIVNDGRVLAARRSYPASEAGKWELPGGKAEPGESDEEALAREIAEELGVNIRVSGRVGPAVPLGVELVLHTYHAELVSGSPDAVEHSEIAWLSKAELGAVEWLAADRELLPAVAELLA